MKKVGLVAESQLLVAEKKTSRLLGFLNYFIYLSTPSSRVADFFPILAHRKNRKIEKKGRGRWKKSATRLLGFLKSVDNFDFLRGIFQCKI